MQIIWNNTKQFDQFAVYRVDVMSGGKWLLVFVGTAPFDRLTKLSGPRCNHDVWRMLTSDLAEQGCLTVVSLHDTDVEARHAAEAYQEQHAAALIRPEPRVRPAYGPIRLRRNDGKEFNSIRDAAEYMSCSASTISHHLAKRHGYGTVYGFTFERIEN
jgi:hypothetical protein